MVLSNPKSWLQRLRKRLSQTGDTEPEQAVKLRLTIGVFLVLYYCFPWSGEHSFTETFFSIPSLIALNYYLMALGIVMAILHNPRRSPVRRVFGMSLDMISLSAVMFLAGGYSVPLFVLYLWVILGNGFRYGIRYLYISQAISLMGFIPAILWGSFWQQNQSIGASLLIILCVLPLYSAFLLKKLHAAIDSAKQANEAKSRFLANMSHELRTPLNGVIGMGDLLRETSLSFEQHELVNSMHTSANTLLELIENVLDISKIEAGKLTIESSPFDLHALVNSIRFMLAPMGESKGLAVSCNIDPETPFSLNGDQLHLRQVLVNLTSNAIKFTKEGSVNVNVFQVSGSQFKPRIRFEIKDTGIGMDEAAQKHIFENFTQADASTSRRYGGTGLGTTISRDLVELMGGEMGLTSAPDEGSTFWFELPFVAIPGVQEDISNNRLLLLSGEETAAIVRPALKSWEIDFDWARSPARAFSLLVNAVEGRNSGYEIIVVDQSCMEDVNPVQFAQMVKAESELDKISMILLNSSDSMMETNLINQFYIATLEEPQEKRLLFNAIHAAQSVHFNQSNVVTLAEHYARQGNAKELEILVAEDNRVNQQVIEGILKSAGHSARLADSGEKALDILAHDLDNIDLVILDMNMPEKSGIDVVKTLRFMDTSNKVPVIMLTADATPDAKEASLAAGANSFLTKPIDARVLIEKIALLTRNVGSKRQKKVSRVNKSRSSQGSLIGISPWFDENVLQELSNLGNGLSFVRQLVNGFNKDGEKHIKGIRASENDDYPAYRESLHALKGSATELGANTLVEICLKGEKLKPYDLGSEKIKLLNREIERVFNLTVSALQEAVSGQAIKSPQSPE